jgi:Spy/CpxP family protein refolding chaperone
LTRKTLAVVMVLLMAGSVLFAQAAEKKEATPAPACGGQCGMMQGSGTMMGTKSGMGMGMGMQDMMPYLTPDVRKKLIDQKIKFTRDNAALRTDLRVKQLEMKALWLDDEPNADNIIAKMREINKLMLQLKENEINNRFAIYKLIPAEQRKGFWKGMGAMGPGNCSGGMGGCGMSRCGMSGMGMGCAGMGGMGMGQRKIKIVREIDTDVESPEMPKEK